MGKRKREFAVGNVVYCDMGRCIVVALIRCGYNVRDQYGREWCRKSDELSRQQKTARAA